MDKYDFPIPLLFFLFTTGLAAFLLWLCFFLSKMIRRCCMDGDIKRIKFATDGGGNNARNISSATAVAVNAADSNAEQ